MCSSTSIATEVLFTWVLLLKHVFLENPTHNARENYNSRHYKFLAKFVKGILGYRVFITKENLVLTFSI